MTCKNACRGLAHVRRLCWLVAGY